ncbi:MAG: hypothetical protein IT371_29035 [Deltaproteobacteria bacterium]|nr:hypothetical protein [Deltaproteobacteria bacterium]
MWTRLGLACSLVAVVLHGGAADAQSPTPIRYNEGPGIKLGDALVFHPGIAVEGRYDSNVFYTDGAKGAPYLRLIGHLDISTLSPQRLTDGSGIVHRPKVNFRFKTAVGYREYLSGDASVKGQRAVELNAGIGLGVLQGRPFSFDIVDEFSRTVSARNYEGPDTLARDMNRGSVKFTITPGGGRLSFDVGYANLIDVFEESSFNWANHMTHEILFNAKWRLLPKTALALDVLQRFTNYYNASSAPVAKVNSMPFRASLGLLGLITTRLSIILKAGYGNSIHKTAPSYNMFIGKAELGYQFAPTATLRGGFEHLFEDSMYGNYYTDELAYLRYNHAIMQRFILNLGAEYRYRQYKGLPATGAATTPDLQQHLVIVGASFDWQIQEWVYIGIGYDMQVRAGASGGAAGMTGFIGSNNFQKHQVYGKVGFSY